MSNAWPIRNKLLRIILIILLPVLAFIILFFQTIPQNCEGFRDPTCSYGLPLRWERVTPSSFELVYHEGKSTTNYFFLVIDLLVWFSLFAVWALIFRKLGPPRAKRVQHS